MRDYGNGQCNTGHHGSLPGTSYVVRVEYRWDHAVVLNRCDESGNTSCCAQIDAAMWNACPQIIDWRGDDQFPSALPVVFRSVFEAGAAEACRGTGS